jgi:tetraacyldisaccharide 4'-kinase
MPKSEGYLYCLATDKERGIISALMKILLLLLSLFYGLIVRSLIFFYGLKPRRLDCKVISIGNITVGGTGKTPVVEFVAKRLREQGRRVAILSRGYKRLMSKYDMRVASYESIVSSYENMGDEPFMLKEKLGDMPVLVDYDRIRSAGAASHDYGADTVLLDDGFQQWKIKKDLEIVTINAANPFGNRHMLPRGILREPLGSLKRADILVLTKTDLNPDVKSLKEYLRRINPSGLIVDTVYNLLGLRGITEAKDEFINASSLKGGEVCLVCGIADPASFEALIKNAGLKVGLCYNFPDHYCYSKEDLVKVIQESDERNIDTIITTEKDSVRFPPMDYESVPMKFLAAVIELKINSNEKEFNDRLSGVSRR